MKKKYYYIIGFLIVILLCLAIMTTCNAFSVKCEDQKECNIVFINNVVINDISSDKLQQVPKDNYYHSKIIISLT